LADSESQDESPERAGHAVDRIAANVHAPGLIEDAILGEDFIDGRTATHWIVSPNTSLRLRVNSVEIV
jgi:hypothetical protein